MASIRKRNGRWQAQVRRVGKPAQTRTFNEKADAIAWAKLTERRLETGDFPVSDCGTRTLSELLEKYQLEVVPLKRTDSSESYMLKTIRLHPISKKQLRELRAIDFAKLRDEMLHGSRPATVVRKLSVLRHALSIAHNEWGWTVPVLEFSKIRLPPVAVTAVPRISNDDINRLISAAEAQRDKSVALAVRLALFTAMRRGELLKLRWEDVDLDRRALTIRTAKNGHGRIIPLTEECRSLLANQKRVSGPVVPISCNALRLGFQRAKKKAQTTFRFHDLRHESISRFFDLSLTVPEVQLISGHKTISQLSRYAHPDVARVVAKLNSKITQRFYETGSVAS